MKIDVDMKKVGKCFDKLEGGETFYHDDSGTVWMKLENPVVCNRSGEFCNAVSLDMGNIACFDETDCIIPIKTKLILDNENDERDDDYED